MENSIAKQMEMVLYRTEDDSVTVSAIIKDESIWITQKAMAELFGVQTPAISKHLKNIFEQGELKEDVVISKMETTTPHGAIPGKTQSTTTNYYNLDAIISVGYRVNSIQANVEYGNRLRIYLQNVVLIIVQIQRLPRNFMRLYRTSFTMQSRAKRLRRLYMNQLIIRRNTWD